MLAFDLTLAASRDHGALRASAAVGQGVTLLSGPSGAGKSTLLALLAGALPPQQGQLSFRGVTWSDGPRLLTPSHLRGIGWQPQLPSLVPHWSAAEHLRATERYRAPISGVVERAVKSLDLLPLMDRPVAGLSFGEAQRVALLRALVACRGLLLLDEPVTALQPALATEAMRLVQALTLANGWTTFIVSHQPLEGLTDDGRLTIEAGQLRAT